MRQYLVLSLLPLLACQGETVPPCTVVQGDAGGATISCPNGEVTLPPGRDGEDGDDGEGVTPITKVEGNVIVQNSLDLARLASVTYITGSIIIASDVLTELDLPALETVDGSIITDSCGSLTTLSLPSLRQVNTSIEIADCPLVTLDLSRLASVGTPTATLMSLPPTASLIEEDYLSIYGCDDLPAISLPALTTIQRHLYVGDNASLTKLEAPQLSSIGGGLSISENSLLTTLDGFPSLKAIAGDLWIYENGALTDIGALMSLEALAGDLHINSNPELCQSDVDAFLDHLNDIEWAGTDKSTSANKDCSVVTLR